MTFDPTKPVRTRDGRAARIICTDAKGRWRIVALVDDACEGEKLVRYTRDGTFHDIKDEPHHNDLINIPEQTHCWYNVYDVITSSVFNCRKEADTCAGLGRRAVLHLIFEDDKLVSSEVEHV